MTSDPTYIDRVLARAGDVPDTELLRDPRRSLTGGRFIALVAQLARALEQRGLGPGDRVALLVTPSCDAVAMRYAAGALGCVGVFCPHRSAEAFAGFLASADPALLVVSPERADAVRALPHPVASLGPAPGVQDDLLAAAATLPTDPFTVRARPQDTGALSSSGGTTGVQKASRRTFAAWERMVDAGPMPDRRQLVCMPLAYVSSVHTDQTLLAGGTVIFRDRFEPADVLATIEAERITNIGLVEPLLAALADHPDVARRDLSSLRAIAHIGVNAPASLRRRWLERLGPVLLHPYGGSEMGIISLLAPPDYALSRPHLLSTSGRPLPGIDLRIEAVDGTPLPTGQEGEIVVRTSALADGYAGGADGSSFVDGSYCTGDLGWLDADGYLHVHGRAADVREIDGARVMPLDVEDVLCAHPGVHYAVALPGPVPDGRFHAAVVLAPDAPAAPADVAVLRGLVADRATVSVVERIPLTEQGKPDRAALRAQLGATA